MQRVGRWFRTVLVAGLLPALLSLTQIGLTQGTVTGAITGTVSDPSGAVVAKATVVITNVETNISRTLFTDDNGSFALPNLPISTYTVKVSSPGFSTELRENVRVSVGKDSLIDVTMTAGRTNETVTVQAEPVVAMTEDRGDRSVVLAAETLTALPIQISNGPRQPDAFLTLAPGVTGDTFSARINGAPNFSQDFYYDGVPYMNADGGGRQEGGGAPFETIDEYAINTNAYSAQYGRSTGQLDFHIHSGTNQLHGSAWEFLRNNVFDAPGYFAANTPTGKKAGTEKQNEYGFKVGGPVRIPWVYNGRDKTFFFGEMGWYKFRGGNSTSLTTLPTAKMLTGDFSELPFPIYDPRTTRPDGRGGLVRDPFPGNIIGPGRLSSVSAAYLPLIPAATLPGVINNAVVSTPAAPTNNFTYLIKIDHNISSKLVLHGSYYYLRQESPTSPVISGPLGSGNDFAGKDFEPRLTLDQNLSPRLYNQTAYSWQYTDGARSFYPLVPSGFVSPIATSGQPYPALSIQNMPRFGSGADNGQISGGCYPCVFFADNLKYQKGRHSLSFGAELRWEDEKDAFARNLGSFTFSNGPTSQPDGAFGQQGYGFASFYLGLPITASRTGVANDRQVKTGYKAFYAQDDIKFTNRLTVNAGLRWDVSTPVHDNHDQFSTFDPTVPNPLAGGLPGSIVFAGNSGGPCIPAGGASLCRKQIADTYYGNWQPRVGFAFRATPLTVLRGGFGKATLRGGANALMGPDVAAGYLTGFQYQDTLSSLDNGVSPPPALQPNWDVGLPPIGAAPPRTRSLANGNDVDYMQRIDGRDGYTMGWSLTVEQQLPYRFVLETSYVGSSNVRIGSNLLNTNQVPSKYLSLGPVLTSDINSPAAMAAGIKAPYAGFKGTVQQALRPFPQYTYINERTEINGHSTYHSLQMRAQKNFSDNMSALVSFTWAKNITNSSDQFSAFNAPPLDTANHRLEKAPLNGLANGAAGPLTLSIASTYELPVGPGKRFLNSHGPVSRVVGGWGASAVLTYNAGGFLPIVGGSPNPIFNSPRPNRVPGVNPKLFMGGKFHPQTDVYLNAKAFSDAGPYALGNAPPVLSDVRNFPLFNENISLVKRILIWRESNFVLRCDSFNTFNRTRFSAPDVNFNDALTGFGKVSGQSNQPRVLQFGARVDF